MDQNTTKAIIVVAPECPAVLVQELFQARILPEQVPFEVLLPPEKSREFEQFLDRETFPEKVQFMLSPARRFFSADHLKWLKSRLKSSQNTNLLICKSPFQDLGTALISLLILFLSAQTITLLFATPEAAIDLNGQGFSDKWITQQLNSAILVQALPRAFSFLTPWHLLYFLMFWGLIVRQRLVKHWSSSFRKPK